MKRRSRLSRMLVAAAAASLLVAGGATAATPAPAPLPIETDGHGVHLVPRTNGKRGMVLTFDDSAAVLYRQAAGRSLRISCVRFSRKRSSDVGIGFGGIGAGDAYVTAPRQRRPIVVALLSPFDYCSIGVEHGRRTTVLTRIALTPLGAVRLDERNTAATVIQAIHILGGPARPSAAQVAARLHAVALGSPEQAPPSGALGVYSDGAVHVYAAQTDHAGKLLFVEEDGDVTRTNLADYLTDPQSLRP